VIFLKTIGYVLLTAIVAVVLAFGITWLVTPSTNDIVQRVIKVDKEHNGIFLKPNQVPKYLALALISVEDQDFYYNRGVSIEGMVRALIYDVENRCACQGGSTITEQLAKDIYLGGYDRNISKLEDIVLALKIAMHVPKPEVLALYFSEVYLGDHKWGAQAASLAYFHKPLKDDSIAQYALLAGLPQAPSLYDPFVHPGLAKMRRDEVLKSMYQLGFITKKQELKALASSLL